MRRLKFWSWFRPALIMGVVALATGVGISGIPEGESISMDFQNADIRTVLRSFSVYADRNIIAGPEVEGPVSVHLEDMPWRQALDIVLKANGYAATEDKHVCAYLGFLIVLD